MGRSGARVPCGAPQPCMTQSGSLKAIVATITVAIVPKGVYAKALRAEATRPRPAQAASPVIGRGLLSAW
jgi:hypothetical protein